MEALTTPERYQEAIRDVRLFLEGRQTELSKSLRQRMEKAAEDQRYEAAAKYRDLISTVEDLQDRQRIAAVEGNDTDVFGYHLENGMLAVNLFHMRGGRVLDRREFFWDEIPKSALQELPDGRIEFDPGVLFSALLKQLYLEQRYVPRSIYIPVDFEDRETLEESLSECCGRRVEIAIPQRGEKRSLMDLASSNAKQSYDQRFRVMKPATRQIQEALQDALMLPELPRRIECFDISHIQGVETVASMVVWEDGKMKKGDYRKFIIRSVDGVDDYASCGKWSRAVTNGCRLNSRPCLAWCS